MPRRSCRARGHSKQRSRLPSASPRAASLCNPRQVPYPATKIQNPNKLWALQPETLTHLWAAQPEVLPISGSQAPPRGPLRSATSIWFRHQDLVSQTPNPKSRVSNPETKKRVPKPETLANFGGLQTGPFIFLALIGNFSLRRRVIDRTFAAAECLSETCSALELRAFSCIFLNI